MLGSVLTLITGGVLWAAVDDQPGARISIDTPTRESGQHPTLYFPAPSSQTTLSLSTYLGGLMECMNEQSLIIEDLTIYPYCINLKREPNAKMKF